MLSTSPRSEDWHSYLLVKEIVHLYDVKGELGAYMRTLSTKLCLTESNWLYRYEGGDKRWSNRSQNRLVVGGLWLIDKLLKRTGKEFSSLFVDDKFSAWILSLNRLMIVKESLPNVKSLSIVSADQRWIEAFGRTLYSLEIGRLCNTTFADIQEHCSNLRSLTLSSIDVSQNDDNKLWEAIGATLETLVVRTLHSDERELLKIQGHCRKLRSIHILNPHKFSAEYMELLESYGEQLEYATISDFSRSGFENMVKSCSNARFRLNPDPNSSLLHLSLAALGPQLHEISCLCHCDNVIFGELMPMSNICTNLRAIQFVGWPDNHILAFFETPKVHLESITLSFADDSVDIYEMLDIIASKTGALKKLKLSTMFLPNSDMFSDLIFMNKSLTHINCIFKMDRIPRYSLITYRQLANLTDSFLKAPHLRNLEICDMCLDGHEIFIQAVNNVCRKHIHRLVRVLIIGVEYLR